jgi:hypothetical protein
MQLIYLIWSLKQQNDMIEEGENFFSLKLISNAGHKITNNQIADLCIKFQLPFYYIVDMLEYNYSMVWFKIFKQGKKQELTPIANQISDGNILDFPSDKPISPAEKTVLDRYKPMPLPKADVVTNENFLLSIKQYKESKKHSVVTNDFDWESILDKPEPIVNWKKVIRIDIKKYNQEQLKVIAEQFQLFEWCLLNLKKVNAVCVFWDTSRPYFMAYQLNEDSPLFEESQYKGLKLWNATYSFLSKRDKDKLLKIQPADLNTKKKKVNKNEETFVENVEELINEVEADIDIDAVQTDLNMDSILDKISKSGIESLSKEERIFLDSFSK